MSGRKNSHISFQWKPSPIKKYFQRLKSSSKLCLFWRKKFSFCQKSFWYCLLLPTAQCENLRNSEIVLPLRFYVKSELANLKLFMKKCTNFLNSKFSVWHCLKLVSFEILNLLTWFHVKSQLQVLFSIPHCARSFLDFHKCNFWVVLGTFRKNTKSHSKNLSKNNIVFHEIHKYLIMEQKEKIVMISRKFLVKWSCIKLFTKAKLFSCWRNRCKLLAI